MIVRLQTTVSTMLDAAALAARGEPHGTVVVAEEQTGGVGRHGHAWHSPGNGLYLSIILRLPADPAFLPVLTMALGLAAQRAVDDLADVSCDIRWPNDVILNEKKLAGIMVQSAEGGALIAGIGINVNQNTFPAELRSVATSLRIETGRDHSKEDLLQRVVSESLRYAGLSIRGVLKEFEKRSTYVRGKAVEVDGKFRGITAGLDESGFLLVSTPNGVERVLAGGVRPV
jgi:BirA family biotin operon repressor/biotin-[acetyl-CoA-carboxylase] ligase